MRRATRVYYAVWSAVLFLTELAIALWAHGFVRDGVGDMLIIPLIYCLIRVFTDRLPGLLPFLVCCLGFLAEFLQYIHLVDRLGLRHDEPLAVAIGTSFSWTDILCYLAGMGMIYIGMLVRSSLMRRKGEA